MSNRIILDGLALMLDTLLKKIEPSEDEYAFIFSNFPESHVFYPEDFDGHDVDDAIMAVMDQDIRRQIAWHTDTIERLKSDGLREPGGYLADCDGFADHVAAMEAERIMGC